MLPARLLQVARQRGLDRLAITDHNTIAGALEAAAIDPEMVIVGEEIMTTQGELLGYFVQEEVPPGLSPLETIDRLRAQGAVISVSHPLDAMRGGAWREPDLRAILPLVDALEIKNARTWSSGPNQRASDMAQQAGLAGTAGSDAHAYREIGRAVTLLPEFSDAAGLRRALSQGRVQGEGSSPLVHLYSRYATLRKALGWRPPRPAR